MRGNDCVRKEELVGGNVVVVNVDAEGRRCWWAGRNGGREAVLTIFSEDITLHSQSISH